MPLPSSGSISLSQVNTELGRSSTAAISMGETAVRNLFGVASGAISMSQGYGKANQFAFSFAGGTDVNLRTAAVNAGWNQSSKVVATNTGNITASSTGVYALTINGSFPGGVEFTNNGLICGRGGNGGQGTNQGQGTTTPGSPGAGGGPALIASSSVTITNNGTIAGGGGGGGGGGGFSGGGRATRSVAGAGGGGGIGVSLGGPGGVASGSTGNWSGAAGNPGTISAAGTGGPQTVPGTSADRGGAGGNGGGYGSAGSTGGSASVAFPTAVSAPGPGGAAGAAVVGNGNISWAATGTRLGGIS